MPEKKERLDLPPGYDAEAAPVDFTARAPRGAGELATGLKQLARLKAAAAAAKDRVDSLTRTLLPQMDKPVVLIANGERVLASASQARPITVDAGALRQALLDFGFDEDDVEVKMGDVLKPPEVDTKENGRLERAVEEGRIPLEVFAKVAKEKPSSAYISFAVPKGR